MNRPTLAFLSALLLSAAPALAQQVKAFQMAGERSVTGLFYWDPEAKASPGQIFIHYGAPTWQAKWEEMYVQSKKELKVRLGKDHWTTLDLSLGCKLGGVDVSPGIYYLGLHKTPDGKWQLMLLDPADVKKQGKGPFQTKDLTTRLAADLIYRKVAQAAETLQISVKPSKSDASKGALAIHFGNHVLQADFEARMAVKKASDAGSDRKDK